MTDSAWWARRLSQHPYINTPSPPPGVGRMAPQRPALQQMPRTFYPPSSPPVPQEDASSAKATASKSAQSCPECGGGNYAKVGTQSSSAGTFEVRRCFDCGFPLQQSGGGLASNSGRPSVKAQQISGGGYNPGQIVGRLS